MRDRLGGQEQAEYVSRSSRQTVIPAADPTCIDPGRFWCILRVRKERWRFGHQRMGRGWMKPDSRRHRFSADQVLSDADQVSAHADQMNSDTGRAASEADQASSDADQMASDIDQAMADRTEASTEGISSAQARGYATARAHRLKGSLVRLRSTAQRAQALLSRQGLTRNRVSTSDEREARSRLRDESKPKHE